MLGIAFEVAAAAVQQPTFREAVRTVAIYATVTEPGGRLVPDPAQGDFEVDDNRRPQHVTVFANDIQPITVVMMLDRSGSMRGQFERVEKAAEQFVGELLPADKARIGSFADRIQVDPRDFTNNKQALSRHSSDVNCRGGGGRRRSGTPSTSASRRCCIRRAGASSWCSPMASWISPSNPGPLSNTLKGVMKRAEEEDVMVYAIGLAAV